MGERYVELFGDQEESKKVSKSGKIKDGDLVFDIQKAEKEVKEKEGVVDKDEGKLSSWFEDGLRGSRLRPPMRRK